MCGIFGYIADKGKTVNASVLTTIAERTESRGRHAFGFAWFDSKWNLHSFKMPGAPSANRRAFLQLRGAKAVIGHCRWATHGDVKNPNNNHPHPSGDGFIVHNGIVRNYRELLLQHNLKAASECDSEVVGLLFARGKGDLAKRIQRAMKKIDGGFAFAAAAIDPETRSVALVRRGNPLHASRSADGLYFASEYSALAKFAGLGKPESLVDSTGVVVEADKRLSAKHPIFVVHRGAAYSGEAFSGPCGSVRGVTTSRIVYDPRDLWTREEDDNASSALARFDPEYRRLISDCGLTSDDALAMEEHARSTERRLARRKDRDTRAMIDDLLGDGNGGAS